MSAAILLGFIFYFAVFLGKAEETTITISKECDNYELSDGIHYLKITQDSDNTYIIEIECNNGDMIINNDYVKYFIDNNNDNSVSSSSAEITVADDEVKTGINPIDNSDSSTATKKWASKSKYIIFLVIVIMVSLFILGIFLILYWFCCQYSRQNDNNDCEYDYLPLKSNEQNKNEQNTNHNNQTIEYVTIPANNSAYGSVDQQL